MFLERITEMDTPLRKPSETPLRNVRPNIVQSIRAYRIPDLQAAAEALGSHFLYANLAHAQTKADVFELLSTQFYLPAHFGKNWDALYDCMTDPINKSGPQPGFVVVLDQMCASSCWTCSAILRTSGQSARFPSAAFTHSCRPAAAAHTTQNARLECGHFCFQQPQAQAVPPCAAALSCIHLPIAITSTAPQAAAA